MLFADVILIFHFLFLLFVVGGLPIIWIGARLGVDFVRNVWFRYIHLAAISVVVVESLLGMPCPLTIWEDSLRQFESDQGFIQRWLHYMLFYDLQEWIFTVIYLIYSILII